MPGGSKQGGSIRRFAATLKWVSYVSRRTIIRTRANRKQLQATFNRRRESSRGDRLLQLDQQVGTNQQMPGFRGRETEIAKDIARRRCDLQRRGASHPSWRHPGGCGTDGRAYVAPLERMALPYPDLISAQSVLIGGPKVGLEKLDVLSVAGE